MISHNRAQALASARMDDTLAPDDERALQLHLLGCVSCRHFATQADGLAHGLRGLPQLPPSSNVSRQVMETVTGGRSAWLGLFGNGFRLASSPALAVAGSLVLVAALAFTLVLAFNPPGDRSDRPSVPGPIGDQAVVFATETAAAEAAEPTAATARRRLDIAGLPTATTAEEAAPSTAADAPTAEAEPTRPTNVTVTVTPTSSEPDGAPVPPADMAAPTGPPSEARSAEEAAASIEAEQQAAGAPVETEVAEAADMPAVNPPSAEEAAAAFASPTEAVAPALTAPVATPSPPPRPEPTPQPSRLPESTAPPLKTATAMSALAPPTPRPNPTEVGIVVVATARPAPPSAADGADGSGTVATDRDDPVDVAPTVAAVEEPETVEPGPPIVPSEGSEVVQEPPGASSEAPVGNAIEDAESPVEAPIIESVDRDPGSDRGLIQGAPVDVPAEPGIGLATPVVEEPLVAVDGSDAVAPAPVGEAGPVAPDDAVPPVAAVPTGAAEARPDRTSGDGDAPPIDREADAAPRDERPPRERRADDQGENEGRSARNDADAPRAEDAATDDEDARRTATQRRRQERDGDGPRPSSESPPIVAAPSPTPIVIAGVTVHLGEPGDPAVVVGRGLNGATRTPEPVE